MSNTSATGGPLTPTPTPAPLEGQALQNFLHDYFAGITALPGNMVRPRWQPEPANMPSATDNWLAFGITNRKSDTFAAELHVGTGDGYNEIRRHEVLNIALSFYGPDAENFLHLLREGVQVAQNREALTLNNMGLVDTGDATALPELVKDKWYYRIEMEIRIRRQIVRNYAVQNLLDGQVSLNNEVYVTQIEV
jgi:hypothetical protein